MNQFKLKIGGEHLRIETDTGEEWLPRYKWCARCVNLQGEDPVAYADTEARAIEKVINLIADFQQLTRQA
jgi:hypothetical protein